VTGPLKVALVALNRPGYRSLALGYIRAYAEADPKLKGRVAFQTLDLTTDLDPWWIAYRVLTMGPDVVGFSVTCWCGRDVLEACRVIKAARPDTRVVLGGPEVGPDAEWILERCPAVDAVVRGEGEVTFAELLRVYLAGKTPWKVPGVTARDGERVVAAPDRPPVEVLDDLPSPYLTGVLAPQQGGAYVETYRGCPHQCGYCFEGKGLRTIRSFSEERVSAEIQAVTGAPGVDSFSFIDSVFNLTPERLRWLADLMEPHERKGVRLHTIEVDIERVDEKQAALLRRASVASVETGPQSVGAKALDLCRRRFDPERFRRGVRLLRAEGISVECDLIVGLPGDTVYDFVAGLRFVFGLDPGKVQTSTLHVLPGTDLWMRADELGLRFDREPPHEVVCTDEAAYPDLRRAEVLSLALKRTYEATVEGRP
jgi:radical SAM superfamily enzyme YgiQ (UPF0313 family)